MARPLAFPLDYVGITRVLAGRDGRRVVRTVNEIAHVADLLAVTGRAVSPPPSVPSRRVRVLVRADVGRTARTDFPHPVTYSRVDRCGRRSVGGRGLRRD